MILPHHCNAFGSCRYRKSAAADEPVVEGSFTWLHPTSRSVIALALELVETTVAPAPSLPRPSSPVPSALVSAASESVPMPVCTIAPLSTRLPVALFLATLATA